MPHVGSPSADIAEQLPCLGAERGARLSSSHGNRSADPCAGTGSRRVTPRPCCARCGRVEARRDDILCRSRSQSPGPSCSGRRGEGSETIAGRSGRPLHGRAVDAGGAPGSAVAVRTGRGSGGGRGNGQGGGRGARATMAKAPHAVLSSTTPRPRRWRWRDWIACDDQRAACRGTASPRQGATRSSGWWRMPRIAQPGVQRGPGDVRPAPALSDDTVRDQRAHGSRPRKVPATTSRNPSDGLLARRRDKDGRQPFLSR